MKWLSDLWERIRSWMRSFFAKKPSVDNAPVDYRFDFDQGSVENELRRVDKIERRDPKNLVECCDCQVQSHAGWTALVPVTVSACQSFADGPYGVGLVVTILRKRKC